MALIFWGELDAATDSTMATAVDTLGSRTRDAVQALVASLIAGEEVVADAAAAAVAAAILPVFGLAKCVHRDAGVWVWDGPAAPAATHYLIPDETGALIVRPTPFPTPLATPALDW